MTDQVIAPVDNTPPADPITNPIVAAAVPADTTTPVADAQIAPAAPVVDTPSWDDGWREKVAGEDEKTQKRLERFTSVKSMSDALIAAQDKIRSGEVKFTLKDGATPEEVTAWRKDNGIPEKYSEYDVGLVDESNKASVESFLKMAHEKNFAPDKARAGVEFIVSERQRVIEGIREKDNIQSEQAEEVLRKEWGADFKGNFNAITNLLSKNAPEGYIGELLSGRLANGTAIGDDPATLRFLASVARELNPFATILPGSGTNQINAAQSRLTELEGMMGDDNSAYNKGGQSKALQAEYLKLTEATLKQRRMA